MKSLGGFILHLVAMAIFVIGLSIMAFGDGICYVGTCSCGCKK